MRKGWGGLRGGGFGFFSSWFRGRLFYGWALGVCGDLQVFRSSVPDLRKKGGRRTASPKVPTVLKRLFGSGQSDRQLGEAG